MDDDILPQALTPPLPTKDLTFDTPNAEKPSFMIGQAMQQHAVVADFSPLTAMLQSLGQPLTQLLNAN